MSIIQLNLLNNYQYLILQIRDEVWTYVVSFLTYNVNVFSSNLLSSVSFVPFDGSSEVAVMGTDAQRMVDFLREADFSHQSKSCQNLVWKHQLWLEREADDQPACTQALSSQPISLPFSQTLKQRWTQTSTWFSTCYKSEMFLWTIFSCIVWLKFYKSFIQQQDVKGY